MRPGTVSKSTWPGGYSSRAKPLTRRTTAKVDPSGAQSAWPMSSRISRGGPPASGARDSTGIAFSRGCSSAISVPATPSTRDFA